jgi:hypothetical protein
MNMRRFYFLLIWLLFPAWLSAQTNISAVEYWYDGNYGTANRQTVTGADVSFTDLLDVSSLEPGLHTATFRFQDDRGVWGSVLSKFFTYYPGTSPGIHQVTDVEYWFDGNYSTVVEVPLSPGVSTDLNTLIDVSSLIVGLHTVSCRFKDNRGIWGAPLIRFFKKEASTGLQQIVALEYWFNDDYNNRQDSVFAATSLLELDKLLNVSSLNIGFHFVNFRLQDEQGKWGPVASWYFTKENDESLPALHRLTEREYWFDGDYSTVQTGPVSSTAELNLDTDLDVSSLNNGLHIISYRFRDEAGEWSPALSHFFVKYPDQQIVELHEIVELEYWFDNDYSTVKSDPVSATAQLNLDTDLDVSSLNNGLHIVSYRFRDEAGKWSPAYSVLFTKLPVEATSVLHKIVAVEYWFNGNYSEAETEAVPASAQYILDKQLDVSSLNNGLHTLSYRFQDEAGVWSSAYSELFSKYQEEIVTTDNKITGYRYWANNQIGAAVEVTLSAPVKSLILDELVDISNFPGGENFVSFQFLDEQGQWSCAISQTYTKVVKPSVSISASDSTVCAGSPVSFSADVFDADVIEWQLGDSGTSSEFFPVHSYAEAGTYQVSAIVTHTDSMKSARDTIVGGITVYPNYDTVLGINDILEVCENDLPFILGTQSITTNGFYTETFTSVHGCDSVVSVNLVINPSESVSFTDTICENDLPYAFNSQSIWTPGQHKDTLKTVEGCDSIITLHLVVHPEFAVNLKDSVCESELPYYFGSQSISAPGQYKNTLKTIEGCDSIITLDLVVHPEFTVNLKDSVCESELPYIFGSQSIWAPGQYKNMLKTIEGCDSIITLDLVVHPEFTVNLKDSVCESELPYIFGSQSISAPGQYKNTLKTIEGCDSIITLDLVVHPEFTVNLKDSVCESELPYLFGSQSISAPGQYKNTLKTVEGCDSIITLDLVVHPEFSVNLKDSVCESELPYIFGSQSIWAPGQYKNTLKTIEGCDSIITLDLVVHPEFTVNLKDSVCESELPYIFGSQSISAPGHYKNTLKTIEGCDSIITLDLVVHPEFSVNLKDSVCESELPYIFGSQSLISSGTYTETVATANGCDSVVTLDLWIHKSYNIKLNETVKQTDLPYIFGDQSLNKAGVYTNSLLTVFGCDSIVTLHLLVEDNIPPAIVCNAIDIELLPDGTYTLTEADKKAITQGTTDNVSAYDDLDIQVSPSVFSCEHLGENTLTVTVSDTAGNEANCQTTILVNIGISPPIIDEIPDLTINEDNSASITLSGISGGNQCETWKVSVGAAGSNTDLVEGLSVNYLPFATVATLDIVLVPDQSGTDIIVVEVTDTLGNISTESFTLTVNPVNDPPTLILALEDQLMDAGDTLTVPVNKLDGSTFSDIDDNSLVYASSIENGALPDWITESENEDIYNLIFTPSFADTGCFTIIVEASDPAGETVTDTFETCVMSVVGIDKLDYNKFEIKLYPNPSKGTVNIDLTNPPTGEIELLVTDISGSRILQKTFQSNEKIIFDLSRHISGSYLIILRINEQRIVRKLILDKK